MNKLGDSMTGKAQLFSWSRTRKAECNVRSWNSRNDSSPVRIARNWIILITLSQIGLLISSHDPPRLRCPDWTCSLFFLFLSLTRSLTNPPLFLFVAFFSFFSLFFFVYRFEAHRSRRIFYESALDSPRNW